MQIRPFSAMTSSSVWVRSLSWLVLPTPTVQAAGLCVRGLGSFRREKLAAAPICHRLSGQISPFFTGMPTRWMGPLHHSCMGPRRRRCTARLFDSWALPPAVPPHGYHQGSVETATAAAAYSINWIIMFDSFTRHLLLKLRYASFVCLGTEIILTAESHSCNVQLWNSSHRVLKSVLSDPIASGQPKRRKL